VDPHRLLDIRRAKPAEGRIGHEARDVIFLARYRQLAQIVERIQGFGREACRSEFFPVIGAGRPDTRELPAQRIKLESLDAVARPGFHLVPDLGGIRTLRGHAGPSSSSASLRTARDSTRRWISDVPS
jgi:hypothetical protein